MTFEMYERVHDLCEEVDRDPAVRIVVLRGAGDRAFVSGTDIPQFLDFATRDDALRYEGRITRVLGRLHALSKPTIAMVQGDAVGGGLFMALACDLRLAAAHVRLGAPLARTVGNCVAPLSFGLLAMAVGPVRARELLLTARLVESAEALALGLVVHEAAVLEARVDELAVRMSDLAPLTLAAVKETARRFTAHADLAAAEDVILSCYLSEDFREGVRAFLEKRKPDWQGR